MSIRNQIEIEKIDLQKMSAFTCVDMHFHSNHSHDSFTPVDKIVARAKKLGITFALTDHDVISGCEEIAKKYPDFAFIPGIEVRCDRGFHTLIYFYSLKDLQDYYKKYVESYKKNHNYPSAEKQIGWAKQYGAVCSAAHPFAPGMTAICSPQHKPFVTKMLLRSYDAMEVIQGGNIPSRNFLAIDLAEELKSGITGGSDGHILSELGQAVTYVSKKVSMKEFLDTIKKKKNRVRGSAQLGLRMGISTALKIKGPIVQRSYYIMRAKEAVLALFS